MQARLSGYIVVAGSGRDNFCRLARDRLCLRLWCKRSLCEPFVSWVITVLCARGTLLWLFRRLSVILRLERLVELYIIVLAAEFEDGFTALVNAFCAELC